MIVLLISFSSTNASAGTMTGYGVIFAPTSDYASLNTKGHINMIQEVVSGNWQSTLDEAEKTGQRLVVIPGWQDSQICQGGAGWSWNGSDWSLNSNGTSFMDFIASYIKSGKKGFLALYTVHEPYNYTHSPNCNTDAIKKLYSLLKNEAVKRGLTSSQLPLYADIDTTTQSDFGPGVCDYCADWYYPNGECSGSTWEARVSSCISKMKSNYQGLAAKSPNSTFVVYAQSFGGIGGYTMPSASEMEYEGNKFIGELKNNFNGNFVFAWYTWSGQYPIYLKNSPGGDASYQVMANVYNASGGSLTPTSTPVVSSTPTPTTGLSPTPTSTPPPKDSDLDKNGQVNAQDMIQLLTAWGPIFSSAPEDLDSNGKVNSLDAGRIVANWTGGPPASPTPIPLVTNGLDFYGVKFAGIGDYAYLASLGVMNPVTNVNGNSSIDSVISAAREVRKTYPKFKPVLWQWPEGWSCSGINSTGTSFINYLNTENYWDDILAIYGLHEPLGSIKCASLDRVVNIHNQIYQLSGGKAKIFGKMYSDVSYQNMGFKDGICDYCGVMYHPYRQNDSTNQRSVAENCPASGRCYRKNEMIKNLERDLTIFKSVPPGVTLNKFNPYLGIIQWPDSGVYGTGQYMPGPDEMLDGGTTIVNYVNSKGYRVDGLIWYTWENNSSWIGLKEYNGDGLKAGRMDVINQVGIAMMY